MAQRGKQTSCLLNNADFTWGESPAASNVSRVTWTPRTGFSLRASGAPVAAADSNRWRQILVLLRCV